MLGMKIGEKHTFDDFGLKMLLPLKISNPEAVEVILEVPGRDGKLDLSEALGEIRYKDRKLEAAFDFEEHDYKIALAKISEISNYVSGIKHRFILDSDPEHYYEGRAFVSCSSDNFPYHKVEISANVYPYKIKLEDTIITAKVMDKSEVICFNERKSVVPEITANAEFLIKFNGNSYAVPAGTTIVPNIKFIAGENKVVCEGAGEIAFKYQEGSL